MSDPCHSGRARDATGALCGVAAGAAALSAAQVGGKVIPGTLPPLQVLGDFVIRVTPVSITEALIRQVGRSDKLVLLICMLVVAALAAALVGVRFARGHVPEALVGIAVLAVLPVTAARGETSTSPTNELLLLLPAGCLGAALLWALGRPLLKGTIGQRDGGSQALEEDTDGQSLGGARSARRKAAEQAALLRETHALNRRQVLRAGLVLSLSSAIGTVLVRNLGQPSQALMRRLQARLPATANVLPVLTDEFGSLGAAPLVTSNSRFYRIDTALSPPLVDPDSWTLRLTREGERVAQYSYDDLLAKATTQADITIGCVSNEIGGDLVGTARWQGVLLADLLREAGINHAGRISGISVDGFVASFRGALAFDGRPAMIALGMNGQPLPVRHGFPARLVVPGLYGYTSATKWLQTIDVSNQTDLPGFWAQRGWDPDVAVHVMSRIDAPRNQESLAAVKGTVAGVAWAPVAGVGSVQVQVDDGLWQQARLSAPVSGTLWRQWAFDWTPQPGEHTLRVRASDADGVAQDIRRRPVFPSGATGLHEVRVIVR